MPITPQEALSRIVEHREIFHDEMLDLMRQIMGGEMSPVLIAAFTIGLRVKKETIGEITAAATRFVVWLRSLGLPRTTVAIFGRDGRRGRLCCS